MAAEVFLGATMPYQPFPRSRSRSLQLQGCRKTALIKAFDDAMRDPKLLLAEATKQRMDIDPMTGRQIDNLLARIYVTPTNVVAKAAASRTTILTELAQDKWQKCRVIAVTPTKLYIVGARSPTRDEPISTIVLGDVGLSLNRLL